MFFHVTVVGLTNAFNLKITIILQQELLCIFYKKFTLKISQGFFTAIFFSMAITT